jgi:hypothetical protein
LIFVTLNQQYQARGHEVVRKLYAKCLSHLADVLRGNRAAFLYNNIPPRFLPID